MSLDAFLLNSKKKISKDLLGNSAVNNSEQKTKSTPSLFDSLLSEAKQDAKTATDADNKISNKTTKTKDDTESKLEKKATVKSEETEIKNEKEGSKKVSSKLADLVVKEAKNKKSESSEVKTEETKKDTKVETKLDSKKTEIKQTSKDSKHVAPEETVKEEKSSVDKGAIDKNNNSSLLKKLDKSEKLDKETRKAESKEDILQNKEKNIDTISNKPVDSKTDIEKKNLIGDSTKTINQEKKEVDEIKGTEKEKVNPLTQNKSLKSDKRLEDNEKEINGLKEKSVKSINSQQNEVATQNKSSKGETLELSDDLKEAIKAFDKEQSDKADKKPDSKRAENEKITETNKKSADNISKQTEVKEELKNTNIIKPKEEKEKAEQNNTDKKEVEKPEQKTEQKIVDKKEVEKPEQKAEQKIVDKKEVEKAEQKNINILKPQKIKEETVQDTETKKIDHKNNEQNKIDSKSSEKSLITEEKQNKESSKKTDTKNDNKELKVIKDELIEEDIEEDSNDKRSIKVKSDDENSLDEKKIKKVESKDNNDESKKEIKPELKEQRSESVDNKISNENIDNSSKKSDAFKDVATQSPQKVNITKTKEEIIDTSSKVVSGNENQPKDKDPLLASMFLSSQKKLKEMVSKEQVHSAKKNIETSKSIESVKESAKMLDLNMDDEKIEIETTKEEGKAPEKVTIKDEPKKEAVVDKTTRRLDKIVLNQNLGQKTLDDNITAEIKETKTVESNESVKVQTNVNRVVQKDESVKAKEVTFTMNVPSSVAETIQNKIIGAQQKMASFMSDMARNMYLNYKPPMTAFRISLNPASLGSISIVMRNNKADNSLSVSMNMSNSSTMEAFVDNRSSLQNALQRSLNDGSNISLDFGMQNGESGSSFADEQNKENSSNNEKTTTETVNNENEKEVEQDSTQEYM